MPVILFRKFNGNIYNKPMYANIGKITTTTLFIYLLCDQARQAKDHHSHRGVVDLHYERSIMLEIESDCNLREKEYFNTGF